MCLLLLGKFNFKRYLIVPSCAFPYFCTLVVNLPYQVMTSFNSLDFYKKNYRIIKSLC